MFITPWLETMTRWQDDGMTAARLHANMRQTWKKQTPWTPRSSTFFRFSAKFADFSAKFRFLDVQIRNNLEYIIFIACNICKYYVNSLVISCSTCQKEEKECIWLNMWFTQSGRNFNFVTIYAFLPPKPNSKKFRIDKKIAYSNSGVT